MRKEIYENQGSSDTLPFHWEFGKEEITLKVSSYAYGNGLAVLMYIQSEGELELFSDLTVNLPGGYGLKPHEAFVSGDFTRDKLAFIQENRLGKVLPGQARSGFATYTPVAFDLSRLARYDREGVEEFCRQWGLDIPKEQEKVQGKPTGKKKRERERSKYMEVKMNKEIRNYQESMFMGLNLRQCIFSLLAIAVAVGIYFGLGSYVGQEMTGWLCILGAAPFAACGFFQYHGMNAEQFAWAYIKSEFLYPKRLLFQSEDLYHACMEETLVLGEKSQGDGTALMKKREQRARKKRMKQKKKPGRSGAFD